MKGADLSRSGTWVCSFLLASVMCQHLRQVYYQKKSLATLDCFAPYLINVATKEYCSICLETGFISEEFCLKILVLDAAAEQ